MQEILDNSSNMDVMFRNMHEANPDFIWLYGAFEGQGHIFRNYPYDRLDPSLISDYNPDGTPFDPHLYTNNAYDGYYD